jgi:omega-6 fatty acid desaturase (delta-12 desaturase)
MTLKVGNFTRANAGFVRSKMPQNRVEKSIFLALLIFSADIFAYLLTFWIIILVPFWSVKIVAIPLNALFIGALFIIGHDACHGSFVKTKWLNHLIGRIAFLPALNTFTAWEVSHNQLHHGFTNFKGLDSAYSPLSKPDYESLSNWGKLVQRFYRTGVGIIFYYQIEVWWKRMIIPRKSDFERMNFSAFIFDLVLVIGYLVLKIFVLCMFAPMLADHFKVQLQPLGLNLLTALCLPFSLWIWWYVSVTLLHHTHPQVAWFDKKHEWYFFKSQIESSVHIETKNIVRILLNNVFEHTAHHADIRIPLYKLRDSQKALKGGFPKAIRAQKGFIISAYRTLKICKLYDYDNHFWTDFDGNVTSKVKDLHDG